MSAFDNYGLIRKYRLQKNGDGKVRVLVPCCWLWWKCLTYYEGCYAGGGYYPREFDSVDEAFVAVGVHNSETREKLAAAKRRNDWQEVRDGLVGWP